MTTNLKLEIIKLLEVPRTHDKISEAMREADIEGRMDIKTVVKILGMLLDYIDENPPKK